MEEDAIHIWIEGYLEGSLTKEQELELEEWRSASIENQQLFDKLTDSSFVNVEVQQLYQYKEEHGWSRVLEHLENGSPIITPGKKGFKLIHWNKWASWTAAACVLGLILAGINFFFNVPTNSEKKVAVFAMQKDIAAPSHSKAVIQLANGQTVPLDSINQGMLAMQGNIAVQKNSKGQIIYSGKGSPLLFNTIINPRGSKLVSLVLQDGSKVWLNSESSIRYPVSFSGKSRQVEITGEAYFEITRDPAHPFIVIANKITTEVLGTRFNINAYEDEKASSITLLEGKVKVGSHILQPGQQARTKEDRNELLIRKVDIDQVMAWQSGMFIFEDDDLHTVMRQLSRWYDLEIKYIGSFQQEKYSGMISRDLPLMNVLKILKLSGIKYTLVGNTVRIQSNH